MREYIIIVLIVNILVYLSCSIFELSFNLVVWEEEVRKAYAVFFFIINLLFINIYLAKETKNETKKQIR
jgi:hypothetical protein|nr:MAG TPA: hypothetical protein [Caudoviricetes sp.]